ncbi:GNAT family N-acetyltransferase [Zoogloea sp.]|uniref:GNAT family N-acetyltransferase n=1 Tax=Zoogloea sp. TaxID=49181 RepID=UPI00141613A3|nr:MAG: GNAT family N-acetyltransferase [Zoogloea sp.]
MVPEPARWPERETTITDAFTITSLDRLDEAAREAAAVILEAAFNDPERYGRTRILGQLQPADLPFYRRFFIALRAGEVVGVGGVKAADWASDTHILYLSAVAEHARGQGIARALISARIAWVMETFGSGRLLVSTARSRRFARLGFRLMGKREAGGRRLMLLEF